MEREDGDGVSGGSGERQAMLAPAAAPPTTADSTQSGSSPEERLPGSPSAAASSQRCNDLLQRLSDANQMLAEQNQLYRESPAKSRAGPVRDSARGSIGGSLPATPAPAEGLPLGGRTAAGPVVGARTRQPEPEPEPEQPPSLVEHEQLEAPETEPEPQPQPRPRPQPQPQPELAAQSPRSADEILKVMMVVEQGKDLPVMDLLSSDPYVKVWHQEAAPPRQPRKAAAGTASPRRCCCSGDTKAPVEFRSTTLTHIGQSPFVKENLNPVWKFRCEHELTLRPGHRMDKGWLCVEIWDYDRVGNDDPMGTYSAQCFSVARCLPLIHRHIAVGT